MDTLRSRVATLPLVAGSAVLDLVNTVSWRGDPERSEDHLATADDCLTWCLRTGVLDPAEADQLRRRLDQRGAARLVDELRALRDVVADVVGNPDGPAVGRARDRILDALAHGELVGDADAGSAYAWRVSGLDERTGPRRLALQLHALLTTARPWRVGVCDDEQCRWVFLDTSRGRRRRWCDSQDCGNRYRVRLHQQRHATTA